MTRRQLLTAFLLIFAVRLGWIGAYRTYAVLIKHSVSSQDNTFENGGIARSLLAGKGFYMEDNSAFPSGPTAHKPPAFPFLLACSFKLFGTENIWPVRLLQAALMACAILLVALLFGQIFDPATGRITAVLLSLSPVLAKADVFIENAALTIFFSAFCLFYFWKAIEQEPRAPAKTGLFMGFTTLSSASFIPFFPFAAAILFIRSGARRWRKCAAMLGVAFCIVFPWTLRNHAVFGRWIPVMSTFPFNFWMGSNPQATGSFTLYGGEAFPIPAEILQHTRGMNEAERNAYFGKLGWQYAREHPVHFLKVRLKAWFFFWMTSRPWMGYRESIDWINVLTAALMIATALAGFGMALRTRPLACWVFGLLFFSYSFVYGLSHADSIDRYRLPLDPYLLGFSAYWLRQVLPGKARLEAAGERR